MGRMLKLSFGILSIYMLYFQQKLVWNILKPTAIHLHILINGQEFLLGTLSFNVSKEELSYYFAYPVESLPKHKNLNSNQLGPRLEHITWHSKGVHIKRVGIKGYRRDSIGQLEQTFFPISKQVKPILVQSFYLNGGESHLLCKIQDFKKWLDAQIQIIAKYAQSVEQFSLMLLLIPADYLVEDCWFMVNPEKVIFKLDQLSIVIGRIQVFEEWDILAVVSPHVIPIMLSKNIVGAQFALNYAAPAVSINEILRNIMLEA